MNIRVVVADERRATFFDVSRPKDGLREVAVVENPVGRLKDTDLETDRPGRRFGGAQGAGHGPGPAQGHHHGVNGERSTLLHELTLFAKEVGRRIDADRNGHKFDKLVIIAAPKMLGLLRQSLPSQVQSLIAAEIPKDLVNHGPDAILAAIPREAFFH
ncbi:MAG TPA: host attachment protein [Steroidobacteraceae bacterium]